MYSNGGDVVSFSFVFDCDLHLSVGSHPSDDLLPTALFDSTNQFAAEIVGEWHKRFSLIRSIPDHESLITSTDFLFVLVDVDTLGDIWGLFVDGHDDSGSLVVHTNISRIVSYFSDGVSGNLFKVDFSIDSDLSENHADTVLDCSLTCNFGMGVLLKAGVKDGI